MADEAEQTPALAKCLAPLAGEGFPIATWSNDAVALFTVKRFIKAVNILTHDTDKIYFRRLIDRGNAGDWWDSPGTCTPDQMYNFCSWLKSSEGAAYIDEQRHLRRLEKKAFPWLTVAEGCCLRALEAQLNEFVVTEKATRGRSGTEMTMEEALRAIKADYAPASAYIPPNETELGEICYKVYNDACARRGMKAKDLSAQILIDVRAAYGNEAVAMHRRDFMKDGGRRMDELKVWLEGKIVKLDKMYECRQANSFRFYLKMMGAEVDTRVRAEVEERAIAAGSRRGVRKRVEVGIVEKGQKRSRSSCP